MTDRPARTPVNGAVKKWFHALRGLRRGAAAAAAVTLAAGMTATPAVAAIPDPSAGSQPQAGAPRDGVQVAQNNAFGRPAPRPAPAPVPPEQQSPYDPAQPARPGRAPRAPEVGPPQPEGLIQLTPGAEELLRAADHVNNYQEFTQEQQDAALALARLRQQLMDTPVARAFPEAEFFESDPPGLRNEGPSLLPADQRQAISRQLAKDGDTEPVGYLNPYETWRALGPAKEAEDRLAGDRQWLGDQLQASKLPADVRDAYQETLNDTLSRINQAETQDQRNALIDQFNSLKDDFNRAEMGYRDDNNLYGEEDRQVPRALDPGLPEPAPENLREARAAFEEAEHQDALDAAQEHALEPGVMNGGDVNTGDPDTDPGPVGGNGQDDPAKGTTGDVNEGRSTDTDTPGDTTDGPSTDNSQNGTDTSSDTGAGETGTGSEGSDSSGDGSTGGDSSSTSSGSTSYGGSDSSSDGSTSSGGDGSSSSGGDGGGSSGGE